jgi:heme a synthase
MQTGVVAGTSTSRPANPWPHRVAMLTTTMTLLLILAGGLVTTTRSGLAVPDWPTSFGYNMFTLPWSRMVGGVFYEHSHRLIGSVVGMLTLLLAGLLWLLEERGWVRGLGLIAVGAVAVQGTLGGLRVLWLADSLAILHGALAQAFFGLVSVLGRVTAQSWHAPMDRSAADARLLPARRLALATSGLLYLQIVLGTFVTHLGVWIHLHILVAGGISVAVPVLGAWLLPRRDDWPELVAPVVAVRLLWVVQLALGLGAYAVRFHAAAIPAGPLLLLTLPVAHRIGGALLLAASLALTLRLFRRTERLTAPGGRVPAVGRGIA